MLVTERISDLRKDIGYKQIDVANYLNIPLRTYGTYERAEIEASDDIKMSLAKLFNVSIDYLVGLTNFPTPLNLSDEYVRVPFSLSEQSKIDLMNYLKLLQIRDSQASKTKFNK